MTNKVAIQWLKGMRKTCVRLSPEIKALDLAIKALEDERPTEINCSRCAYFKLSKSAIENITKFMFVTRIRTIDELIDELNRVKDALEEGEDE